MQGGRRVTWWQSMLASEARGKRVDGWFESRKDGLGTGCAHGLGLRTLGPLAPTQCTRGSRRLLCAVLGHAHAHVSHMHTLYNIR